MIGASLIFALGAELIVVRGARIAAAVSDAHRSVLATPDATISTEQLYEIVVRAGVVASPPKGTTLGPCLLMLAGFMLWSRAGSTRSK